MKYYKNVNDDIMDSISAINGNGDGNITESEYNAILSVIRNKPKATDTTDYRLREDLTWEAYEVEPVDPTEEDITSEELADALEEIL